MQVLVVRRKRAKKLKYKTVPWNRSKPTEGHVSQSKLGRRFYSPMATRAFTFPMAPDFMAMSFLIAQKSLQHGSAIPHTLISST